MDIMTLGMNGAVIGSIIALTKVLVGFDKNKRFGRYYPLLPLAFGFLAALFITVPWGWQEYGKNALLYGAAAAYIYKVGKTTLLDK